MSVTMTKTERFRVGELEHEDGAVRRVHVFDTQTTSLTGLVPLQTIEKEHQTVKEIARRAAGGGSAHAEVRIDSVDLNLRHRCLEYRLSIIR